MWSAIQVRLAILAQKRYTVILVFVLLSVMSVALQARFEEEESAMRCFICGCTVWTHFVPAPFGCMVPDANMADCWLHLGDDCDWITVPNIPWGH